VFDDVPAHLADHAVVGEVDQPEGQHNGLIREAVLQAFDCLKTENALNI
jgi:hypothetical protein